LLSDPLLMFLAATETAFAAFWKINGMVCPPEQVYTDPGVVAATQKTLSHYGTAPPVPQPTRDQLDTALAG